MLLSRIITLSLLLEKYLRLESKSEKKDPRIHNSAWPSANSTNCLKYISFYHFTIFVIPKIVEYFQNWMAMKNWRMEEYLGNKYKLNLPI